MKKEALSQFTNPDLILLSFLVFLACFIGIVIVTLMQSKKKMTELESLPFETHPKTRGES